jgi:proteasome lid subunit RPN8/RPN11
MNAEELPDGYNMDALNEIVEKAKKDVETEYGTVFMPPIFQERIIRRCRDMVKDYNSVVAYEEMKNEIIKFIKVE